MPNFRRYILAGGSGFVGSALAEALAKDEQDVVILTRSPQSHEGPGRAVGWDGKTLGDWTRELDGSAAVVNLAGKNANTRWSAENKQAIRDSRVETTRLIGEAIANCQDRPAWVNASAIGYYGDRGDEILTESSPPGDAGHFLAQTCIAWESAVTEQADLTRQCLIRIGVILGHGGGAYPMLARLTKFFLGGAVGSGQQWMSPIHLSDMVAILRRACDDKTMSGVYNGVCPEPVRNAELMRELRRSLRRPWSPPAPTIAVKLGSAVLGIDPSLALESQRVIPARLVEAGFKFAFPTIPQIVKDLA